MGPGPGDQRLPGQGAAEQGKVGMTWSDVGGKREEKLEGRRTLGGAQVPPLFLELARRSYCKH